MEERSERYNNRKKIKNYFTELKESRTQIEDLAHKNEELDKEVAALRKEVAALQNPPVAIQEKPGPQKEVEVVDKDSNTDPVQTAGPSAEVLNLEKKLLDQKRIYIDKLVKLKKEFEDKFKMVTETPPQEREEKSPIVVRVTSKNKHRVSSQHKGMLKNPDGTFSTTPQFETWALDNEIQLEEKYDTTPKMPEDLQAVPNHPRPSKLNLKWSYKGEWILVPKDRDYRVHVDYRVGRIETYVDTDGLYRKALSYGEEDRKLTVWYDLEGMFKAFPEWEIPEPIFYNGKRFRHQYRRKEEPTSNDEPGDQSTKDIQRGRSKSRGAGQYHKRGSGRSTSRGGGRPTQK